VHDDDVVLLPVVPLAVVDLVPGALEDVEQRLVLVAVALVPAAREQLDEVRLQRLREERIVPGSDEPRRLRPVAVIAVSGGVAAELPASADDAVGGALPPAELAEAVLLRRHPAQEDASFFRHVAPPHARCGSGERYNS